MSRLCFLILMIIVCGHPTIVTARQVPSPQFPRTLAEAIGPASTLPQNGSFAPSLGSQTTLGVANRPETSRLTSDRFSLAPSGGALIASPELNRTSDGRNRSNVYRKPVPKVSENPLDRTDVQTPSAPAPSIPLGRFAPGDARNDARNDTLADGVDPPPFFLSSNLNKPRVSDRGLTESDRPKPRGSVVDNLADTAPLNPSSSSIQARQLSVLQVGESRTSNALRMKVGAPETMFIGQAGEFFVDVFNLDQTTSSAVEVRIAIPDELTITQVDRDAWLNDQDRTITFSLPPIPGQHKQRIRLRGVSLNQGRHQLQASLVLQDQLLDRRALAVMVIEETSTLRNATSDNDRNTTPRQQQLNR